MMPPIAPERRSAGRRFTMVCCLLVCIGDLDQSWFRPVVTEDFQTHRQRRAAHEAHRDRYRRKADHRRDARTIAPVRAVQIAERARRVTPAWIHENVEPLVREESLDSG